MTRPSESRLTPTGLTAIATTLVEARRSQLATVYRFLDGWMEEHPVGASQEMAFLRAKSLANHRPFKAMAANMNIKPMILYWSWVFLRQDGGRTDLVPQGLAPPDRGGHGLILPRAREVTAEQMDNWVHGIKESARLAEELEQREQGRLLRALGSDASLPPSSGKQKNKKQKAKEAPLRYSHAARSAAWNAVKTAYPGVGGAGLFNERLKKIAERGEVPQT